MDIKILTNILVFFRKTIFLLILEDSQNESTINKYPARTINLRILELTFIT